MKFNNPDDIPKTIRKGIEMTPDTEAQKQKILTEIAKLNAQIQQQEQLVAGGYLLAELNIFALQNMIAGLSMAAKILDLLEPSFDPFSVLPESPATPVEAQS
jgi:hypothetical protein